MSRSTIRSFHWIVTLSLVVAVPIQSLGQDCFDYEDRAQIIGQIDTPDNVERIVVRDHFAYCASDHAGLVIIDFSDPTSPVVVGQVTTSYRANDVALSGNLAYIADGSFRDIIETGQFAQLATSPVWDDFRQLDSHWRQVIPEYVKDYVTLNKFM